MARVGIEQPIRDLPAFKTLEDSGVIMGLSQRIIVDLDLPQTPECRIICTCRDIIPPATFDFAYMQIRESYEPIGKQIEELYGDSVKVEDYSGSHQLPTFHIVGPLQTFIDYTLRMATNEVQSN